MKVYDPIVPQHSGDEAAKQAVSQALSEQDTIFLLFRSTDESDSDVQQKVAMAETVAKDFNESEWRVLWLKKWKWLPAETITTLFGGDEQIVAVSLRWGTGEPREVVHKFKPTEIDDNIKVMSAFAEAGPKA